MKGRVKAWLLSAGVWLNGLLLAAFPFADQIIGAVNENLPALAPYLPPNVYKLVGVAVVAFNMIQSMRRAQAAAKAKAVTNG